MEHIISAEKCRIKRNAALVNEFVGGEN